MSFFGVGGNPFASQVGMKIERATMETLPSEDWSLNMEICDIINNSEEGPRDAMKAIRKRLASQPKNYTIIMYTLTIIESCVKNCGRRFHILVCSKDFIQELVKLIGPKNDPPAAVQEKVLSLIQSWAETFRHQPDLSGVSQVYADLKHKGVEFPPSNIDMDTPIFTPDICSSASPSRSAALARDVVDGQTSTDRGGPSALSQEQKTKLSSELHIVESNAKVLAEMLNELTPGKEDPEDLQLLKDLFATCQAMQQRVVDLVGVVADDLLTADILRINDELNNVFVRYERHMSKHRGKDGISSRNVTAEVCPGPTNSKKDDAPLIDLGEESNPVPKIANLGIANKNEDADFDSFAQSRTAPEGTATGDSAAAGATDSIGKEQKMSDFDEMEQWLRDNPGGGSGAKEGPSDVAGTRPAGSVSSSEFDRFLAERAAAADDLPTIPAAIGSRSDTEEQRNRSIAKEDNKDKQLFSL